MTDYAATIWKCSVANAQKSTPNTTGSGSEKQTGGASLDIVRLLGDSSRKMSSTRCMQAQWPKDEQQPNSVSLGNVMPPLFRFKKCSSHFLCSLLRKVATAQWHGAQASQSKATRVSVTWFCYISLQQLRPS